MFSLAALCTALCTAAPQRSHSTPSTAAAAHASWSATLTRCAAGAQKEELVARIIEQMQKDAALSEEEKRNSELLLLVRRADKEMQDITQRDRDLAARLTKWREEVRNPTAFEYTAAKCSLTQHCCSTAC